MRAKYRDDWLKVRRENPNITRKQLFNTANFLYLWLKREDADWFKKHSPQPITGKETTERLNWEQTDQELSEKVESVCREILSLKEFPVRICITEIIRRIGYKTWIDKREEKLSLTTKTVDKYLETKEDYIFRKIEWTTRQYIKEKNIPTKPQFKVRAVIRNTTADNSIEIQQAINYALIEIEKSVSSS